MKKTKFTILLIACLSAVLPALAQRVEVVSMRQANLGHKAYFPTLVCDGTKLLTTGADYTGLRITDLASGATEVISTAPMAGYGVQASLDGKSVTYNESVYSGVRRQVKPMQYALGEKWARTAVSTVKAVSEDFKIAVYVGDKRVELAPNGDDCRYIWVSASPDGTKVLYTVSGVGTYVCNLDGTGVTSLGILRAPKWVNSEWVVGMNNISANRGIEKSSIDMVKVDGSCREVLTPSDMVAVYPSANAGKIAFATTAGEVYVMEISIND